MMHFFYVDLSTEEHLCGLASLACSPTEKTPETASNVIHSSEREGWQGSPITLIAFQIFKLCSLFGAVAERAPGRPCFRGKVLRS